MRVSIWNIVTNCRTGCLIDVCCISQEVGNSSHSAGFLLSHATRLDKPLGLKVEDNGSLAYIQSSGMWELEILDTFSDQLSGDKYYFLLNHL